MSDSPTLYFEFTDVHGKKQPMVFQEPLKIIQAHRAEEVEAAFSELEEATKQGLYVAGYVSYEAAPAFDEAYKVNTQGNVMPIVWFGVFDKPLQEMADHAGELQLNVSEWRIETDYGSYQRNMNQIREAIEKGDTYQINYTTRMRAQVEGEPYHLYEHLSRNQSSSYCAYLDIGQYSILSASPELFFRKKGNVMTTKPMKGTSKRGRWYEEDVGLAQSLFRSEKNRSENLMIVDLLRNDLGRIAKPGTVHVPKLFEIETYPTVHQMTSTIIGEIDQERSIFDWFRALFPCGSITGAPKVKTMEYISGLEQSPREVYCGAIGYVTPEKDAVFNVPIRTVWVDHHSKQAEYGTGGGVTWDSTSEGEYEELKTKAKLLTDHRPTFQLLETMKLEGGIFPLMERHMDRLTKTASYFGYKIDIGLIREGLYNLANENPSGQYRVRLLVNEDGSYETQISEISEKQENMEAVLAKELIDSANPFLYHKTTHRAVYKAHESSEVSQPTSVLLWNERQELTEFIIGNVVVELEGKLFTPPVKSGLLAGTFRAELLETGVIEERVLYKDDLSTVQNIWLINAVRGWIEVKLV